VPENPPAMKIFGWRGWRSTIKFKSSVFLNYNERIYRGKGPTDRINTGGFDQRNCGIQIGKMFGQMANNNQIQFFRQFIFHFIVQIFNWNTQMDGKLF
jgi:hypothetical protein